MLVTELTREQKAFYQVFVGSVLLCWSPLKAVAYLAPFLALAWFVLATHDRLFKRRALLWGLVWLLLIGLHALFETTFLLPSALLSIVTYSSSAFLLVVPNRGLSSPVLYKRILHVVSLIVLIEAALGISQASYGFFQNGTFDLDTGDYVEGTIHPGFEPDRGFANPMFATNIGFSLLALWPAAVLSRKGRGTITLGALALILASVVHILIFLTVALGLSIVYFRPPPTVKTKRYLRVAALLAVCALPFFVLKENFEGMPDLVGRFLQGQSPRAVIVLLATTEMPSQYPYMPWVGLGPGQFSSRAALIGTGMYFGGPLNPKPLPLLSAGESQAFQNYLEGLYVAAASDAVWGSSATQKPFFSWLSVYTEFGALTLLGTFLAGAVALVRLKKSIRTPEQHALATAVGAGILFLLFLGSMENYWEVPQAIFLGILLLKLLYANAVFPATSDFHTPNTA